MGPAKFDQSSIAPKLRFRVEAEDDSGALIRLKVEINTREIEAFDPVKCWRKVPKPTRRIRCFTNCSQKRVLMLTS